MSFPKYPEYKDSGVEWLGEVPRHWTVTKFSRHFAVRMGETIPESELIEDGLLPVYSATEKDKYYGYVNGRSPLLKAGDLVIPARGNSIGHVKLAHERSTSTQTTIVANNINPNETSGEFTYYWSLGLREILFHFDRTAIPQITTEYVSRNRFLLPPRLEQMQIASFLDHETARIDALVEQQQRLIELLKEKRQAVISHAVTKGLDPHVPMKDSGVEWLGEVPAHWRITRVKHIVHTVEQGWSPQCENSPVESESEWGVLKVGCVNHGRFVSQENKKLPDNLSPRLDLCIKADDVLISRANTRELVGSCAVPAVSYPNLMLSDKLFRLRVRETVADPRFLAFFMGAPQTRQQIELEATGASSSMLNIGQSTVLEMPFPCPPLEEQAKIRDEIIKQTWSLLDLAGQALELQKRLEERRSALISAAVTGKIDVRGWHVGQHAEQAEVLLAAEERAAYVYGKEPSDEV